MDRIGNGKFALNGKEYQLPINNGPNSLHGGINGFDKKEFAVINQTSTSVTFQYTSVDGEEGYPGQLLITVQYSLSDDRGLTIEYTAKLVNNNDNIETIVNMTNHSYFNLDGFTDENSILDHTLIIPNARLLPLNIYQIPTGEIKEFSNGDPFLFATEKAIGIHFNDSSVQQFQGYDHYYLCEKTMDPIVTVKSKNIQMQVFSDASGFQFYTANWLDGSIQMKSMQGKSGYQKHGCFCIETSEPPNSINMNAFKRGVILNAEKPIYKQTTRFLITVLES